MNKFKSGGIVPEHKTPSQGFNEPEAIIPLDRLHELISFKTCPCKGNGYTNMSWNVNFIGTPTSIIAALCKQSETLTGDSKKEFDAALPQMTELLLQNYDNSNGHVMVVKLIANGHAYLQDGLPRYGTLNISLQQADVIPV